MTAVAHVARLAAANITAGGSSFTSASLTFPSGDLITVLVFAANGSSQGAIPTSVTCSSGLVFSHKTPTSGTEVGTLSTGSDSAVSLWTAMGDGSTGTITVNWASATPNGGGQIIITPWTGTKTTNGGLDAIRQLIIFNDAAVANPSHSLAALQDANSMAAGFDVFLGGTFPSVGSGFTSDTTFSGSAPFNWTCNHEFQANVTPVSWSIASTNGIGFAYEIAAPSGGVSTKTLTATQAETPTIKRVVSKILIP